MKVSHILIIVFALNCCPTHKLIAQLSPIVQKAKETSLYTDQINWERVNKKFLELTKNKKTIEQKKEGYQFLINSLKDKHATIRNAKDYSIIAYYTGEQLNSDTRQINQEFMQSVINNPNTKFSYKIIDGDIGHLKIVGIGPGNIKEQSDEIRRAIVELKNQKVNKWIVDLRYNGGGNIEPMISGLAPLIGEGKIGGTVDINGELMSEYTIKNSQFYNYGRLACEMENAPIIDHDEKVVVLLSRYTVSSGEMLAISFKGRPNTLFIGEETGGLTTGNGFDLINNEVYLVISNGYFSDRRDIAYTDKVGVDQFIEFDHRSAFKNDKHIIKAKGWLQE